MPLKTPLAMLVVVVGLIATHTFVPATRKWVWKALLGLGIAMYGSGLYLALVWAPPEEKMGDVGRILYAHVPQIWCALLALGTCAVGSVVYLMKKSWRTDCLNEAAGEVGVYFGAVGLALGSIWAKPTWGVWWDWDPRLITTATMVILGFGYIVLRKFVEDPDRRAVYSSVIGIFVGADLLITYYSVKIWNTLHQTQSTPETVDPQMTMVLRWNGIAFICLMFVFIYQRYLIAKATREKEIALPSTLPQEATS
jgi:heme exporter protein C